MKDGKYYFTSESVTEGHPDKMCDQISDAILDAVYKADPEARVAVEAFTKTGTVIVGGEVTTKTYIDIQKTVRDTIKEIGYDDPMYGFDYEGCGVLSCISEQSPDIAQGVDESAEHEQGAGDQGYLRFLGLAGDDHAYIWVYDVGSQKGETPYGIFYDVNFILNGLDDGYYTIDAYATRGSGGIIDSNEAYCANNELIIELPDFEKDIAVKVKSHCILVDLYDLKIFSSHWLKEGTGLDADLNDSGNIDWNDYSIFADCWLNCRPANWPLK